MTRIGASIAVVAVGIAAVVLWMGRSADAPPDQDSAGTKTSESRPGGARRDGTGHERVPPRPLRMRGHGDAGPIGPEAAPAQDITDLDFEAEPVDRTWAARQEAAVRAVIDRAVDTLPAGARIEHIECRTQRCRVLLTGEGNGVAAAVEALQDDGGLREVADQMTVSRAGLDPARPGVRIYLLMRAEP